MGHVRKTQLCCALSPIHCCHGKAKMLFFCIVVDLHVAVNSIQPLSVDMERQKWVPSALLSTM